MKQERQKFLTQIVAQSMIGNQADLAGRLRKRGFAVTQASVSRDLEELGIEKRDGVYQIAGIVRETAFGIVELAKSGTNLIVARCGSGLASALAVQLDALRMAEIVGTIAGDDTVFIAVKDSAGQKAVLRKLRKRFEG